MPCSIITIIPVFLFIMLSGAVLIYLNFKIIDIKREVDKQNKILLSFISDIKLNLVNNQGQKFPGATTGGEASLASDGALDFVNKIIECELKCNMPVFDVSGPSLVGGGHVAELELCSSDDSDSDDDSSEDEDNNLIIEVSDVDIPVTNTVALPVLVDDIQVVDVEVSSIADEVINAVTAMNDVTDFGNMKVEQLRKIALEKALAPTKEVNKMKKNELLALMTRNK